MVSKCGVGYNPITCNVDCSSIYAWNGAYWNAQGCNIVGAFPCGAEGDCNSPVLSVCQNTQSSPSPTQSTPPPMSTVPASTASPSSPTASSDTSMLTKCCVGQESCTFQVADQGSLSNLIYSIAVGSPVTNCQPGANSDITNTVGGSMTFEETWTVDTSVGLDLGKLQIGLNSQWTHSKSISMDQNIEIVVQPGYKGVLVANVQYNRTGGSMQVGNGQGFPVVSNQPMNIASYGSSIVECSSTFNGSVLSQTSCTSNARKVYVLPATSLILMVMVLLSKFLVV